MANPFDRSPLGALADELERDRAELPQIAPRAPTPMPDAPQRRKSPSIDAGGDDHGDDAGPADRVPHRPPQQAAQLRPQEVHEQADQQGNGARFQGAEQAEVQGKVHRVGRDEEAASVRDLLRTQSAATVDPRHAWMSLHRDRIIRRLNKEQPSMGSALQRTARETVRGWAVPCRYPYRTGTSYAVPVSGSGWNV